jgi:glycopeptide antibiotics resistance protein
VTFDDFRDYLGDFAWFWPGTVITIVLGIMLGPLVAKALRIRWAVAVLLVLGLGLIVSATLTPSREALRFGILGSGSCDLQRIGIASIADLVGLEDPTFNVLLYVPLGVAIGLVPTTSRLVGLIVAAIALPFAIETIQMVVISLDRACQSADISDNLTGLVIGLAIGVVVRWLVGPPGVADDRLPGR